MLRAESFHAPSISDPPMVRRLALGVVARRVSGAVATKVHMHAASVARWLDPLILLDLAVAQE